VSRAERKYPARALNFSHGRSFKNASAPQPEQGARINNSVSNQVFHGRNFMHRLFSFDGHRGKGPQASKKIQEHAEWVP
jgi:hypothetical protein